MKRFSLIVIAFSALAVVLSSFNSIKPAADVYKVDTRSSVLEWYAAKVTGKHNGTILLSGGTIEVNKGKITGSFDIDMTTIEDKDIANPEYKGKLENHLKGPDFFGVKEFPASKFVLTEVTPLKTTGAGGVTHHVKGLLTIKDKTNEISFDANIKIEGGKASCSGSAVVDRSKFDIKYGSKTFFADIGDKMIYDEFTLKFNVTATK